MSKIGRKPIDIGDVKVEVKGQEIHYVGKKVSGVHVLPVELVAELNGKKLVITAAQDVKGAHTAQREVNRVWGLNRALLFNKIKGSDVPFEKEMRINGLGFKAAVSGQNVVFTLGFSHKIDFELPKEVTLEVDKTGQKLIFRSSDKFLVGHVCSKVRALRPPEPYKGTGVKLANEVIARKAGKTKSA
ncbi:MAG: 50S ribosomal protein L6 [Candidatus Dependentiae bacterium]|nr:50S ribosomal protein L6 [Candidatus Dependentiae bacterium]